MTTRTFGRSLGAIALLALVLRVGYVFALGAHPSLGLDGTWYALQSETIANGAGYVDPGRYFGLQGAVPTAQFPPLWPSLLAVFHAVGLDTLRSYRLVGGFIGVTSVVMVAFIGRHLVDARTGLVAALILALSPFMIAADGSLMAESLFIALVTGGLLVAIRSRESPGVGWFALLGLLLGLATLARSDGLVVGVVLVGVTAWCVRGAWLHRLALAGLAGLVLLAVLAPWAVRNQQAFDAFVPLSNNSGSLLGGANCDSTYRGRNIGGWSFSCIAAVEASGRNEVDRVDIERSDGLSYARHHLSDLVPVVPARVLRGWGIWSPTVLADAEAVESRSRALQLAGWPIELALFGVAAAGAVIAVRRKVPIAPLLAVVGAATMVLAASWGNQRFRLVAEPALAVFAAIALTALWSRARTFRCGRSGSNPGTAG